MTTPYHESGLEVDNTAERAAKAPEVSPWQGDQQQAVPAYEQPALQHSRLPFGLGALAFGLLVAGITAIIIGGAVGGGLGGALAQCRSSETASPDGIATTTTVCAAPTSTATNDSDSSEPYAPTPASQVANLTLDCTDTKRGGTYNSPNTAYGFSYSCATNLGWNSESAEGGRVVDVAAIVAYTFQDCMEACAQMTRYDGNQNTGVVCRSVVFDRRLADSLREEGANCWLKNGSKPESEQFGRDPETVAYAKLGSKN